MWATFTCIVSPISDETPDIRFHVNTLVHVNIVMGKPDSVLVPSLFSSALAACHRKLNSHL